MYINDGDSVREKQDFDADYYEPRERRGGMGTKRPKGLNPHRIYNDPKPDRIGGEARWRAVRERNLAQFRNKPGMPRYTRMGVGDGYTKELAEKVWAEATARAKKDMKKILNSNPELNDNDIAKEAIECCLTVMRSASSAETQLKAAKELLAYTKAKPMISKTVTVDVAEEWLASISDETD